ncbi:MAG TPA: valine--tRNA ligase [Candidatus Paceibacterota bacterium]
MQEKLSESLPEKLLHPYDPQNTEARIYELWEKSGFFNPDNLPGKEDGQRKEAFSIILPPPNVTGILHLGSAMMLAIEDIMIRYERMRGKKTLWLPGTDSAAIATQAKVEKEIQKAEGKSRHDLGREELLKRIDKFVEESKSTILSQIRGMGASVDWSRYAYTMDEPRYRAVMEAFVRMYKDELIYRGHRIVNWDPKGQTTISDDEVVYEERKNKFYTFKYGPFEIGTARPETKFGDKYVVMHPDDKRYAKYKNGEKFTLEWINGPIEATVIKDPMIDMEFGTGVMTITPWHSHEDFELAEKYKLDKEQIIDQFGKLLPIAGEFAGMKITEAREKVVEKLKEKGLLVLVDENYLNRVATAERTGGIIEPQIMLQWFINVNKKIKSRDNKSLKELMLGAVKSGGVKILPSHFEKVYFNWIENLRDWCISRQIWFGHRIPVWYKDGEIYCGEKKPKGAGWEQEADVLDTWFSSALWPLSTMGWPEETKDLQTYFPTSVLETGYDIIFFWVARMILMSEYFLGQVPFRHVYLHGIVRDKEGRKISKSLGNNIDPVNMGAKYGTDALRMALISGTAPGTDTKMSEDKIKGYKNFANKIWNITRYVVENTKGKTFSNSQDLALDSEYIKEFDELAKDITSDMENFRFHLASEKIYHYIWHRFADEIIEESKKKEELKAALPYLWTNSLKLLHPFMPFVTEEIWQTMGKDKLLMIEDWPFQGGQDKPC